MKNIIKSKKCVRNVNFIVDPWGELEDNITFDFYERVRADKRMYLPESLGNLENLKELILRKVNLADIPESIENLVNLEKLSLSQTFLTELPESIWNLNNLKVLSLSYTQLTDLSESLGNLVNLEKLYLHHTRLTTLPESISNLQNLEQLSLTNTELSTLPDSFVQLNLEILFLESDKFNDFYKMKKVKDVELGNALDLNKKYYYY